MRNKLSVIKYFLIAFVPLSILLGVAFTYAFNQQVEADHRVSAERSTHLVNLGAERVIVMLEQVQRDLEFIVATPRLQGALEGDESAESELEGSLLRLSGAEQSYSQIRILDDAGQERVRVDRVGDSSTSRPKDELEDESDRYYFRETLQIDPTETYVSRFDLNIEGGNIEEPHRPMIRFGRSIYSTAGEPIGVAIINYDGQEILDNVSAIQGAGGSVLLLDHDGYFLRGPDTESEWGFMFDDAPSRFPIDEPEAWASMLESPAGSLEDDGALIAFDTIHLGGSDLKLLYVLSAEEMGVASERLTVRFIRLYFVLIVFIGIGSVTFASLSQRRSDALETIRRMAQHDQLTSLPNRALLYDRLDQAMARARRHEKSVGIIYFDLDEFKQVNDTYGHLAGDELLVQVAGRVSGLIRETDTLARVGGDEFVLVLTDLDNAGGAEILSKKIIQEMSIPFTLDSHQVSVGCSIGITLYTADETESDVLLSHADAAMYRSKHSGKGTYTLHSPDSP